MREIEAHGHLFEFHGTTRHITGDNRVTTLYCWAKGCEHPGCTEKWTFKSPAFNADGKLVPPEDPSRHYWGGKFDRFLCRQHHVRPPRVSTKPRKVKSSTYRSRQTVSDRDVADMRKIASEYVGTRRSLYQGLALVYPLSAGTIREIVEGRRRNMQR